MPWPTAIKLHRASRVLEITFDSGETFRLPAEFLRVHSPSAEVQGHGPSQRVLQLNKQLVNISAVVPMGNYAVQLDFDDGHNTGLFSWETLYDFGCHQTEYWQNYLDALAAAGHPYTAAPA
ncbi:MAG: 1-(5-phosphoribosyl)-5-((5-phosphoribosylamino)methylideneamino)imidazole-4-carboxamide isomerase [Lysobacterales bacterium CG02_land_8_20_14_3_00_62_12]|nr:MAG: 1-(5-phosphoribosyl)-5-((5-phosphoribosylamino)methylideneamino)imidazole-4-carboxamide isomerase [Xanthomonadales bacterium CG02_land_8_20_14_3_00_62_12]